MNTDFVASYCPELCVVVFLIRLRRSIWHFIPAVLMSSEGDNKWLMTICDITATLRQTWNC